MLKDLDLTSIYVSLIFPEESKRKKITNDVPVITNSSTGRSFQEGILGIQNEYTIRVELFKLLLKHITVMMDKCEKLYWEKFYSRDIHN